MFAGGRFSAFIQLANESDPALSSEHPVSRAAKLAKHTGNK